jgi:pimeloyl-ACP methyl ester carboxylesterase
VLTQGYLRIRHKPAIPHQQIVGSRSLNRTAFLSRSTEHLPLKVPTVFTHGTADPFGSIDELRAAAALIPAPSEIVEVTGARHALGSKTLDVPVLAVDRDARVAAVTGPVGPASR